MGELIQTLLIVMLLFHSVSYASSSDCSVILSISYCGPSEPPCNSGTVQNKEVKSSESACEEFCKKILKDNTELNECDENTGLCRKIEKALWSFSRGKKIRWKSCKSK